MICKNIIKALKGRNHQHRATPCDWSLNLRVFPFHRALPDANANKAFSLNIALSYLFFIP